MQAPLFIAGDWGTSSLRLYLCRGDKVLAEARGPGIAALADSAENTLFGLIAPWADQMGKCPIYLCGMVGSNIGWTNAPYADCPANTGDLAHACVELHARGHAVFIVPGLKCRNFMDAPDTMRGEETQLGGLLAIQPALATGAHLVCLPGTHTKWVLLEDGKVQSFTTSMTGELFAILNRHSVLISKTAPAVEPEVAEAAFGKGLAVALEDNGSDSLQLLFGVRARQLTGGLPPGEAADFLSGILIGRDVASMLKMLAASIGGSPVVHLVGEPALNKHYRRALMACGASSTEHDGGALVLAGLRALFKDMSSQNVHHDQSA
ncbi:MAG: 2-dehydro-3-deoxygalactonokinase [Alphaproteobacteria bacterium]|nr:MAG: 2-dehydro-3-deoxygalactonokinase [Alphaproteobacteria bacterium]